MKQYYKIADLTVEMDAFGITRELARPYLTKPASPPDMTVTADLRERKAAYPQAPEEHLAYIATGRDFYTKLPEHDGMLLHASAIGYEGKAYLFSADSGVGKSTHTWLWQQVFGKDRVTVINDDKPALRLTNHGWYAYGTPWCGKNGINQNLRLPLGGICFLEQGQTNHIERCSRDDLAFRLLKQTHRPQDPARMNKLLSLIDNLANQVPIWRMQCNTEPEAAVLARDTMVKGE